MVPLDVVEEITREELRAEVPVEEPLLEGEVEPGHGGNLLECSPTDVAPVGAAGEAHRGAHADVTERGENDRRVEQVAGEGACGLACLDPAAQLLVESIGGAPLDR